MAENQNISIRADSEPKAMPEATRRVAATREDFDITEHVIYPKSSSELNAIMDFAKIVLAQNDGEAIPDPELFVNQEGELRLTPRAEPEFERTVVKSQEIAEETDLNNLDATAAGLGAGGEGGGNSFVQLARIVEQVGGNRYAFGFNPLGIPDVPEGVGPQSVASATTTVTQQPDTPTDPKTPVDPKPPVDPKDPDDDSDEEEDDKDKDNNGHGNNEDGQDDDNPGNGDGGPNEDPKDGEDEDENPKHDGEGEDDDSEKEDSKDPKEDETEEHDDDSGDSDGDDSTKPEDNKDDRSDSGSDDEEEDGEDEVDPREHQDNGKGNGVDDAPGNSGDTKGDDADGTNTPGTIDSDVDDVIPMPVDKPKGNNGWGNGDDDAPGNSGPNNNAENNTSGKEDPTLKIEDLLVDSEHGNSGNSHGGNSDSELLASLLGHGNNNLLKGNPHVD